MGTGERDFEMTGALRGEADKDLALAQQVGEALSQRGWTLATAESCTGGGMAALVTEIPGCSHWFDRAWVTYSNQSKVTLLGVPETLIEAFGAVSEPVVCAMVEGALKFSRADIVVAVSGVAGPGGGTVHKPVGTVCLAWGERQGGVRTDTFWFPGDRRAIRAAAITQGLLGVWDWASKPALA
ncbi:CinA family protein [Ferrovum sp.]|uniref:CinA family protein n=1 Tax=Ferrovum sp. TaxID=2609467 RepID=UPI002620BFC1|nr:CinA family protein [Ferrovum sp.]